MSTDSIYPKIRFPEFRDLESWSTIKLEDCLLQAPDYGLNAPAVPYSDKLPTYLRITDIADDGTFISENKMSVNAELNENNSLHDGDIVLARTGASVGKAYKYRSKDGALIFAGFLIRIRPNQQILRSEYIYQYLFTSSYKNWVQITSTRSGQPGINSKEYSSLLVPHTSPTEQQKIADCLSSLDKYIDATKRKLELLKEYKNGLIQRLFPTKGKTVPELRFPKFQNDGEWISRPLSDILNYEQPTQYIVEDDTYKKEGTPVLTANKGFILGYTDESFGIYSKLPVIIFDDFTTDKKYVDFSFKVKSSAIKLLTLKDEKKDNLRFIFECMNKIAFEEKEHKRYYISEYQHINIYVPSSLQEQNQIADTLLSIDKQISEYDKKIKALELHKKGLMQQLFPKL